MPYKMNDVTKSDGQEIASWAADPRFFYVYINSGINDPQKAAESGKEYANLCDMGLKGRKADLKISEFEGSLPSRLAKKGVSELFNQVVKAASPWDKVYAKGLRDEKGKLCGITVLMHERKTGKTEIGYMLDPDYHGKGLGTSMVMSALKWARENTNLGVLKADVDPNNDASCGILKKLGLEKTEFHEVGPYKDRDGTPLASQIMEGSAEKVDAAITAHIAKGGKIFHVSDVILDAKARMQRGRDNDNAGNTLGR